MTVLPAMLDDLYIRANSPNAFRSGQWARITGVHFIPKQAGYSTARPVFAVEFVDGESDYWPVYRDDGQYQITAGSTSREVFEAAS